jgi:Periplasmic copper-binding protein (NosD)
MNLMMLRSFGSRWLWLLCFASVELSCSAERFSERSATEAGAPDPAPSSDDAVGGASDEAARTDASTDLGSEAPSGPVDAMATDSTGQPTVTDDSSLDEPGVTDAPSGDESGLDGGNTTVGSADDPTGAASDDPSVDDDDSRAPDASTEPTTPPPLDGGNTTDAGEPDPGDAGGAVTRPDAGRPPAVLTLLDLLEGYEAGDVTLAEVTLAVTQFEGVGDEVLAQDWTGPVVLAAGEHFAGDVAVPPGATLVLAPGAQLVLAEEAELDVQGQLYLFGSEEAPVVVQGEGAAGFSAIRLRGGRSELHGCTLAGASVLLRVEGTGAELVEIDACKLDSWHDEDGAGIVAQDANNLWVHDSTFNLDTPEADIVGQAIGATNSLIVVERNRFGTRTTLEDGVSLADCKEGQRSRILHNLFLGGGDDALDADSCDVVVDGNIMRNFARTTSACVTLGLTSHGLVTNNLFEDSVAGVSLSDTAQALVLNNTFVWLSTGAVADDDARLSLVGNVLWNNEVDLSLPTSQSANVRHNVIDSEEASDDSNIAQDPGFVTVQELPYGLSEGSPALARDYADVDVLVQGMPFPVHEVRAALGFDILGQPRVLPVIDYGAIERP